MRITIRTADPRPIYVQIVDEVRRAIVTGVLNPDEPLPSVRRLAAELRVNPNTVQQAYRELERSGAVYVLRGQGTFVSASAASSERERAELAVGVAERSLREAYRHGLTVDELVSAIREAAATASRTNDRSDGEEVR